ncbi:hypothetical protein Sjap_009396 [Stephania japonica]|uniref:TRUD domain-containing protein n=1 Tax=Stephania japonica TaxID=461633 RepID=A0AAP0PC84_9MAGN
MNTWRSSFAAFLLCIAPLKLKPSFARKLKPYRRCCGDRSLSMATLEEADVGIVCYVSDLPGFRGVLKQRYSDFIVNEVDCDGNVVHLRCLDAPLTEIAEKKTAVEERKESSYESEIEWLRALCGDADAESVKSLIDGVHCSDAGKESKDRISHVVLSPDSDKSHRTAIHNFFKEKFKFLVTDTVDGPDSTSKCIRVRLNSVGSGKGVNRWKRKERGNVPYDSRGFDDWPEQVGRFLKFHLYKENKDTQEALGLIGKMLGIQPRSFGFAGTKDKRAVSTQRVTVFKQQAKRIASLNERLIGIQVGDFCYVNEGLLLGQLQGNRFTITLRGVVADSEDTIKAAATSLGEKGFVNYFGLQRFGNGSVPTHVIGAALLRGEWKKAVSLILDPREGERDSVREVREYYKESCDIEGTIRQLPRYLVAERAILQCLRKCPGNYLQALKAIPRTLRMMYVHSYQSYLWNHAASIRVQKHGINEVIMGDLVYCKGISAQKLTEAADIGITIDSCDEAYDCGDEDEVSGMEFVEGKDKSVKEASPDDLLRREYTIEDVVLPLPGSRVRYPSNDVADVYHELAKKDGISLTECEHNVKEFSITGLTGGYRCVFQKPIDFEWDLVQYTDGNIPLAETDLGIITKSKPVTVEEKDFRTHPEVCEKQSEGLRNGMTPVEVENGADNKGEVGITQGNSTNGSESFDAQTTMTALKMGFTLPTSCYATMAIRELLKTSTTVAFHKTLNQ